MGVCRGKISSAEYCETVRQAVDYIKGGSADAVKVLTRQMESAAEALEFERAAAAATVCGRSNALPSASELVTPGRSIRMCWPLSSRGPTSR